ncbi:MAG: Na+/H+ antiporter NhaC family protein [Clostridia bacterium]|nr:Na+/H+ antiporter NhaC family protein [Clostridia bacterium]
MDAILLLLFGISIILSMIFNFNIVYPLIFGSFCFAIIAKRRGFEWGEICKMMTKGTKTAFIVIQIFIFIGLITGAWRICGTIPFFVYWGTKLIAPSLFILCAFLITCFMALILGSSFGTAGTIGVVMMILARSGGVSVPMTAGAVLAGAFWGDRCSPISSSANLVAAITSTDLMKNIRNMLRSSAVPMILTCIFYGILSVFNPLTSSQSNIASEISANYNLNFIVFLPAVIILILPFFKCKIKVSMAISIVLACGIAVFMQGASIIDVLGSLLLGYKPDFVGEFADIIAGGGLISMFKAAMIVLTASTYSGIIEKIGIFDALEKLIMKNMARLGKFTTAAVVSIVMSMISCNQTLAIMLTEQVMRKPNAEMKIDKYDTALDLEDSAVVTATLIPWNIASAVPLSVIGAPAYSVIFGFYLYALPLWRVMREAR